MIIEYLIYAGILILLASTVISFVVNLIRFFRAPKGSEQRRERRLPMIISSVVFGMIAAIIAALAALFTLAIAFM